ncbi:ATP-grasp domain-containing protein [Psychromonas arctica]|uniref:ATP-grasp domain-containing protein n=1 Tax=Psychromonas arctica TaxID=168275 RepID=UPI002FD17EB8
MKKKIMVLGAGEFQVPIIKKVKEMGHEVIVVSPKGDYPGFKFSDQIIYEDVSNEKGVLSHAKNLNIDGITTNQTDIPVRTMAYVSTKLGLSGIDYETACLFTDKLMMRDKCAELGLDTVKYKLVNSAKDIENFFVELGSAVIVKPVDSQGSRGIQVVESLNDIEKAFSYAASFSRSNSVIVEEFLVGDEFVIEGVVYDGNYNDLVVGDSFYFETVKTFSPYCRQFPSEKNTDLISKFNKQLIESFGLSFGLTHSEVIVAKGKCHLIETAARGGGVNISSKLVKACSGFDADAFMIDIALGNTPNMEVYNTGVVSSYIAFYLPEGTVKTVDGIILAKSHCSYIDSSLDSISVGNKSLGFSDKTSRVYILLSANNHSELRECIDFYKNVIKVDVLTNNGMRGLIWN